jgi:hypothetical protein
MFTETTQQSEAAHDRRSHPRAWGDIGSNPIGDIVRAWNDGTPDQRARLASTIVSEFWAKDWTITAVRARPGWHRHFQELANKQLAKQADDVSRERETGLEPTRGTTWNGKRILSLLN